MSTYPWMGRELSHSGIDYMALSLTQDSYSHTTYMYISAMHKPLTSRLTSRACAPRAQLILFHPPFTAPARDLHGNVVTQEEVNGTV